MPKNIISAEKKQECIAYALAHPEINARQLAADLGIGHSTLSKWLSQAPQVRHNFVKKHF